MWAYGGESPPSKANTRRHVAYPTLWVQVYSIAGSEHHETVWHKMIRQRSRHPEVDDLLNRAEEATTWI